jgi:hypothetical protein
MDTTAFIRKINGEVSRIKPPLTTPSKALTQMSLAQKPNLGAGRSKSTKRELPLKEQESQGS